MSLPLLTAVSPAWETALVSRLEQHGSEVVVVRRCVDLADLLAVATTGQARAVVVSADLRSFDSLALTRLASAGLAVVGLVDPGDGNARRRLHRLGVAEVLSADAEPGDVAAAVQRAVATMDDLAVAGGVAPADAPTALALGDPSSALPAAVRREEAGDPGEAGPGRLVAVWGPTGAPGRTTVAVTLAAELAALGQSTVLADADTYGGSVAQLLGLLDEAPGLAAAARAADHGRLDLVQLGRVSPIISDSLRVLTGIVAPRRWPELRSAAVGQVWELSRLLAAWTVVDCGFSIEQDEELLYDTAAPRRNGVTLTTLAGADTIVLVGSADPVGLQRLVRGLADLAELRPDATPIVVVNRLRASAVGGSSEGRVRDALARYAGVGDPVLIPDDRAALDGAVLSGRSLTEHSPSSPARVALAGLARSLLPAAGRGTERGARRRGRPSAR